MKMYCWSCHVQCTARGYCPSCGTGHGPFYNAERPHAHGTPIPPEPRLTGGAHSLDCACADCQLARVRDGHRDGWPG